MLITVNIFVATLTTAHVVLMLLYRYGWKKQPEFKIPSGWHPVTKISVIIPARNEAQNIGACLDSLITQKYPQELFEVIVVDDHSSDDTIAIVNEYASANVRCISLADFISKDDQINAYKKAAITAGISQSNGTLIVTTDADCTMPNTWLQHIAALYEKQQPAMIVAPVIFTTQKRLVSIFQLIDFMSMQGITAAAHALKLGNMSNGANLAFTRSVFDEVNGYQGNEHLASGDDYLLMTKIHKHTKGNIAYLKAQQAIVSTLPQPDWRSFLRQRIRWASKSGKYSDGKLTGILILVYFFNLMLSFCGIASFFNDAYLFLALGALTVKIAVEYVYLLPVARFFQKEWAMWYFPFLQPIHIAYIVIAGFLGYFGHYEWKGRNVR